MLTVTQKLMSDLGQAGSEWSWSYSINAAGDISLKSPQVTEPKSNNGSSDTSHTHDNPSGTSAPESHTQGTLFDWGETGV